MHVLIIPSEEYVPEHTPGAGIFQHDQALALKSKGIKVGALSVSNRYSFFVIIRSLFGFSIKNKWLQDLSLGLKLNVLFKAILGKFPLISKRQKDGINVIDAIGFYWGDSSLKMRQINKWVSTAEKAFRYYVNENGLPDIIHAHNVLAAGIFANHIKKKYDLNYLITEHSSDLENIEFREEVHHLIKSAYSNSSKNFAVSNSLKSFLEPKYNCSVDFLPNILSDDFESIDILEKSTEPEVRLLHVANLIEIKDQPTLLRAFSVLSKKIPNIKLNIIGDGKIKDDLVRLCGELKVQNQVDFLGFKTRDFIKKEMLNSNLFVLSSKYETFGVVLIEALACGLPVIASNCGGPESIINDSNGKLFEVGNYIQLAEKIEEALATKYDRKKIHADCLKLYGSKTFANKMIKLYSEIKQ